MQSLTRRMGQAWGVLRKGMGDDTAFASGEGASGFASTWSRSNLRLWLTGTQIDYARLAGPMWTNSAFAACLMWVARNSLQAPPRVQKRTRDKEVEIVEGHELPALLDRPNEFYGWDVLSMGLWLSWYADGNGYILVDRKGRTGEPSAMWYCPHWLIEPSRRKGASEYLTHYTFYGQGQPKALSLEQVIQVRFGVDPLQPLKGFNPAGPILREIATDVEATNYSAASLKNRGLIGALITPDGEDATFDPVEVKEKYKQVSTGDNVWDVLALDIPAKLQFPDVKPDDMALDKIRAIPETRIAAMFPLPPAVVGLLVGLQQTKVGATMKEHREGAWEECILPNGGMMYRQIGEWWRKNGGGLADDQYLGMDTSDVRPLQPDLDALHTRVREDYKAGGIDRYTFLIETKREATEEDKGVYATLTANDQIDQADKAADAKAKESDDDADD